MKKIVSGIAAAILLAVTTPALAHHSYAMFDMEKTVDVKGTVKEFHYTNPHTWIVLESQDASGKAVQLVIEANGPGYLVRNGWKRTSVKAGDVVTVTLNPLRDGTPGGSLVQVTFPDGHVLGTRPPLPPGFVIPGGPGGPGGPVAPGPGTK